MESLLSMIVMALSISVIYGLYYNIFCLPVKLRQIGEQLQRIEEEVKRKD